MSKNNIHNLKVGDYLWRLGYNARQQDKVLHKYPIKKIGVKYAELGGHEQVYLDTLKSKHEFSPAQYYLSEEAYEESYRHSLARQRIRHMGTSWNGIQFAHLNSDQLTRIGDVLEGKAGWETLSTYEGQKPKVVKP